MEKKTLSEEQEINNVISPSREKLLDELALANLSSDIRPTSAHEKINEIPFEQTASIIEFDIKGYTSFCTKIPPERVMEIINQAFAPAISQCADEQDDDLRETVFPYISGFVGDAIDLTVTGTHHREAAYFITTIVKELMEKEMEELDLPLDLHVTVAHDKIRSYFVGKEGNKIRVDASFGLSSVELLKSNEDICYIDMGRDNATSNPEDRIKTNATPHDFLNTQDELISDLNIDSIQELPPTGTTSLEGQVINDAPVVFLNLKNFTLLEEHMQDEEAHSFGPFLDELVCSIQDTLEDYGGRILNISGGRVLIMFGRNTQDSFKKKQTSNAITACLALEKMMQSFNKEQEDEHSVSFSIGLSSGRVYYGINGNAERLAVPNVIGEPVNFAARWASKGKNGAIMIPLEIVHDILEMNVHIRELIRAQIKGYTEEKKAVNIAAMKDSVVKGIIPETILPLSEWQEHKLIEKIDGVKTPIIVVGGPQGSGKSCLLKVYENHVRTLEEATLESEKEYRQFHSVSMSSFHADIPFGTVRQILSSLLDIDKNGLVEDEEIQYYFEAGSESEQIVRYLLNKSTSITQIEQKDVEEIMKALFAQFQQPQSFIIQNSQHIDKQNMQIILDILEQHTGQPVQCIFEFDTDEDHDELIYQRIISSPIVTEFESSAEISLDSFLHIAFLELTNKPDLTREAFSKEIRAILEDYHAQGVDLKTLSQRCQIIKQYIEHEGGLYHFTASVHSEILAGKVSISAEKILDRIKKYPKEQKNTIKQLALIGPQFRFAIAEHLVGVEALQAVLRNKKLTNLCSIEVTESGEIVFRDSTIRAQLGSNIAAQTRSSIHTEITAILKQESGNRPTTATLVHTWSALTENAPINDQKKRERMNAIGEELFTIGKELFHQTGSSFFEATKILNRAFACCFSYDKRNKQWKSDKILSDSDERQLLFMLGLCLSRRGDKPFSDISLEDKLKIKKHPRAEEVFSLGICAPEKVQNCSASSLFWAIKNQFGLFYLAQRQMSQYESAGSKARQEEIDQWHTQYQYTSNILTNNKALLAELGVDYELLASEINRFYMILLEHEDKAEEAIRIIDISLQKLMLLLDKTSTTDEAHHKIQYEYAKNLIVYGVILGFKASPDIQKSISVTAQALAILEDLPTDDSLAGYQTKAEALNNLTCSYADIYDFNNALATCIKTVELAQGRGLFFFSKEAVQETIEEVLEAILKYQDGNTSSKLEINTSILATVIGYAKQFDTPTDILSKCNLLLR